MSRTSPLRLAIVALLTAGILAGGVLGARSAPAARGLTPDEVRNQLHAAAVRLAHARAAIAAVRRSEAGLTATIAGLDARLNATGAELARLGRHIAATRRDLTAVRGELRVLRVRLHAKRLELSAAQTRLVLRQKALAQRVVATYKTGDATYLAVILDAQDFSDLVTRLRFVKTLIGTDNELVGRLAAARAAVAAQTAAVAKDERAAATAARRLVMQRRQLVRLRTTAAAEARAAVALRSRKRVTLARVESNLRAWEREEAQLRAESARLTAIIRGHQGDGGGLATGRLQWPVRGPVTSGFGWRVHPIFHVRRFHSGIDIAAAYGTPIHAADGGRVIFAGSGGMLYGYGNVIVIDHGRGLSTLYAHQSRFAVAAGALVRRGQVIGYVGSTGFSTGPHLHFEVRVNGVPVDPMGYLR
jgi:murein DD-endopeptidase MepM/ murein hydrolase activator NlpD